MKAIYACKLYRSSKRKNRISAALADPVNSQLVTQLAEYLDEEYRPTLNHSEDNLNDLSRRNDEDSKRGNNRSSGFSRTPSGPSSTSLGLNDSANLSDSDSDSDLSQELDESNIDTEEDASNATEDPVQNATSITASQHPCTKIPDELVSEIKCTLELREDTSGVNRVLIKQEESELWIHYDDNINLNNVMGPVIELLNAAGYTYLQFNRLARSENAVVFQISSCDTLNSINSIGSDSNE